MFQQNATFKNGKFDKDETSVHTTICNVNTWLSSLMHLSDMHSGDYFHNFLYFVPKIVPVFWDNFFSPGISQ